MPKTSAAQMAATRRYEAKTYERLSVLLKKGERGRFREYANRIGVSLNSFVVNAIEKEIERIDLEAQK